MNVPLSWLAEYVKLPKSEKELTDKLTMIGHMLDKRTEVEKEVVIDLELRGNRSDLFCMVGIARDVSAAWNTPLTLPPTKPLPKTEKNSTLVSVEATELVERFTGFVLSVNVGPSPAWLVKKLELYGVPSINNVVDVTNYVMLETGEPMHAYDMDKLAGKRLIVRRAKPGEKMMTLQGTTITLTKEDLVIADEKQPQGTAIIGSKTSGVSNATTTILLEAAVYRQANVRRTARRLGIRTEAGNRHEKHLDPNQVIPALERAYYLLAELAQAEPVGNTADVSIKTRKPVSIELPLQDILRLTGTEIPEEMVEDYIVRLGFVITKKKGDTWSVVAPTFRTDIEQSADVVEEVIRLYGYDKIPTKTLEGKLPEPATYPMVKLTEQTRDILMALGQNEVITSPIIPNDDVALYEQTEKFMPVVTLVNAPDPDTATLRPSLIPNLVAYAKRSIGFRQRRIALFEVGKTYGKNKKQYEETESVGLIMHGELATTAWNQTPRTLTVYDLKGVVEKLLEDVGISATVVPGGTHPSMDPNVQGTVKVGKIIIGTVGKIHESIAKGVGIPNDTFVAELSLTAVATLPKEEPQPYVIAPSYPPIMEDMTFVVSSSTETGHLIDALKKVNRMIASVELVDVYEQNRSLRITYSDPKRTLTSEDIKPIREGLVTLAQEKFNAVIKTS